jgi:hypothetical protein
VDEYRLAAERRLRQVTSEAELRVRVPRTAWPSIEAAGRLRNVFEFPEAESRLTAEQKEYRRRWEQTYLGLGDDAPPEARPLYAYLFAPAWGSELGKLDYYGELTLILADEVKARSSVVFAQFAGDETFLTGLPSPLESPRLESAFPLDVFHPAWTPAIHFPECQVAGGIDIARDVVDVIGGPGLASGSGLP